MSVEAPEIDHGQAFLFAVEQTLEEVDPEFAGAKLFIGYLLAEDARHEEAWGALDEGTQNYFRNIGIPPDREAVSDNGLMRAATDFGFTESEVIALAPLLEDSLRRTGLLAKLFLQDQDEQTSEKIGDLISDIIDKTDADEDAEKLGELLVKHMNRLAVSGKSGVKVIERLANNLGRKFEVVRKMLDLDEDPNRYRLPGGGFSTTIVRQTSKGSHHKDGRPIEDAATGDFL